MTLYEILSGILGEFKAKHNKDKNEFKRKMLLKKEAPSRATWGLPNQLLT